MRLRLFQLYVVLTVCDFDETPFKSERTPESCSVIQSAFKFPTVWCLRPWIIIKKFLLRVHRNREFDVDVGQGRERLPHGLRTRSNDCVRAFLVYLLLY